MFRMGVILKSALMLGLIAVYVPDDSNTGDKKYISQGEYMINDKIIDYGKMKSLSTDESEAVLFVYDVSGELITSYYNYSSGDYDSFVYLADVGNDEFVLVCEQYASRSDADEMNPYQEIMFKFDYQGHQINNKFIDRPALGYGSVNHHLIIEFFNQAYQFYDSGLNVVEDLDISETYIGHFDCQYEGDAYINGVSVETIDIIEPGNYDIRIDGKDIDYDFFVCVEADVFIDGESNEGIYTGDIRVYSQGELYLNHNPFVSGSIIDIPGNYDLEIIGENEYKKYISFSLEPAIRVYNYQTPLDLDDGDEFYNPISIYSNGQSMILNENPYSGKLIEEPGEYKLIVNGVNGYIKMVNFSIKPSVLGVEDNQTYDYVELNVFGEAYLNGELVKDKKIVSEPGNYVLKLMYDNEVYQEFNFEIVSNTVNKSQENKKFVNYLKYGFLIVTGFGFYLISRKK